MGNFFSDYGYGDIMKVDTTGASSKTAQENKLKSSGLRASCSMARSDAAKMIPYRSVFKRVGKKYGIEPALIAAIISRDSHGAWVSEKHLCACTADLVDNIKTIRNAFPEWTREQQLKGGIAAYNTKIQGIIDVYSCENMDEYTTGGDYSNDVVARAQWYQHNVAF